MDEVIELWKRVNTLIKIRNTTQSALSTKCGFSQRRIQNLSGTNRLPDAVEITKIAEALGVTVEYLVTGSADSPLRDEVEVLHSRIDGMKRLAAMIIES